MKTKIFTLCTFLIHLNVALGQDAPNKKQAFPKGISSCTEWKTYVRELKFEADKEMDGAIGHGRYYQYKADEYLVSYLGELRRFQDVCDK